MEEIPDWFWDEYEKSIPEIQRKLGVSRDTYGAEPKATPVAAAVVEPDTFEFSTKTDLQNFAKARGLTFATNTTKPELVAMIEDDRAAKENAGNADPDDE